MKASLAPRLHVAGASRCGLLVAVFALKKPTLILLFHLPRWCACSSHHLLTARWWSCFSLTTTLPAPFGPLLWQITKEQLSEQRHKDVYGTYKRILALPPEQPSGAGTSEPAMDTGGASTSRFASGCLILRDVGGCFRLALCTQRTGLRSA